MSRSLHLCSVLQYLSRNVPSLLCIIRHACTPFVNCINSCWLQSSLAIEHRSEVDGCLVRRMSGAMAALAAPLQSSFHAVAHLLLHLMWNLYPGRGCCQVLSPKCFVAHFGLSEHNEGLGHQWVINGSSISLMSLCPGSFDISVE